MRTFIETNNLIETNVAGALNTNYAFYMGLMDGQAFGGALTEEQVLSDVWSQEAEIRSNTTEWLYAFLWMAYQPPEPYAAEGGPPVLVAAEGTWMVDTEGNRYLDGVSALEACVAGHIRIRLGKNRSYLLCPAANLLPGAQIPVVTGEERLGEDVVTEGDQQDKFLSNAPDAREGFFAVPKVVE